MATSPMSKIVGHLRRAALLQEGAGLRDEQLLESFLVRREDAAFEALVRRHGPMVLGVCHRVLHDRHDAEDAFQATFLVLIRKAAGIGKREFLASWLYRVAHRTALQARKATARRKAKERQVGDMAQKQVTPDEAIQEMLPLLDQELSRLPDKYRLPIILCDLEGKTRRAAAQQLNLPERTLSTRLARARVMLAKRLARHGTTFSGSAVALAVSQTMASASVPPSLVSSTVKIASLVVAVKTGAAALISAKVAALTEGVVKTMLLTKLKTMVAVLIVVGMGVFGGGLLVQRTTGTIAADAAQAAPREADEEKPRVDINGDPLPDGAIQRIGSQRFRHSGEVMYSAYTPDGKAIVTTTSEIFKNYFASGYLNLWDAATGKLRWRAAFDGFGFDRPLAVSADGRKIAVLSGFKYVEVATETGKILFERSWRGPEKDQMYYFGAIARDLQTFAVSCEDCTLRWYDARTGQEKGRAVIGERPQGIATMPRFSADGKTIYTLVPGKPGVMAVDTKTRAVAAIITKDLGGPWHNGMALSANLLAAFGTKQMILWDLKAGKEVPLIETEKGRNQFSEGAISPDGRILATVNGAGQMVLFDATTGKERHQIQASPMPLYLAFAPDSKTFVSGAYGSLTMWNAETGKPLQQSPDYMWRIEGFANNGSELATVGNNMDWWDVRSGKVIRRHPLHFGPGATSSADGKLLAVASRTGDLQIIDALKGELLKPLRGPKASLMTFSPDASRLYSSGWDNDGRITVWDINAGVPIQELKSDADQVSILALSPDGRWLASAATGYPKSKDQDIRIWEAATGQLLRRFSPRRGSVYSMVFSSDSTRLVSAGGENTIGQNTPGEVQLWDIASGKELRTFVGHQEVVKCLTITPDGRMLATGSLDKTLRLWEVATGMERGRIKGHDADVYSMRISPDARMLAALSWDAPIYLWDPYALDKPAAPRTKLTKEDREILWQQLADPDAALAFKSICALIAHPGEAVSIMEGGWKRLPGASAKQMHKWVEDLGSAQFAVRKAATEGLQRFAFQHEDLLREAFKNAGSVEARQRTDKILTQVDPQRLRRERMLEVLEQVRTPAAGRFLQTLAEQKEDTLLAREAAAGLKRLEQQK